MNVKLSSFDEKSLFTLGTVWVDSTWGLNSSLPSHLRAKYFVCTSGTPYIWDIVLGIIVARRL